MLKFFGSRLVQLNPGMRAFSFFVIPVLFVACADHQAPTLHVRAYCRYDQQENKLRTEATFFEGNTLQAAQSKVFQSGVSFLGSAMETRKLPNGDIRYESERIIQLPQQLPLFFKESPDKEKTLLIPMQPIHEFGFEGGVVSKSRGAVLKFSGEPLSDTEKIILLITDANRQNASVEVAGPLKTGEVKISPQSISKLTPGAAEFYLVRTGVQQFKEGHYELKLQTEFYSKIIRINIGS